jgi:hypothetical protein
LKLVQQPQTAKETNDKRIRTVRQTALIACLAALCIGTNYTMLPLSNVKLMDAIVFTTGLLFGIVPGSAVAAIAWLVYGTLNPLGFALPILLTVIPSEMTYAAAGHLLRRTATGNPKSNAIGLERSIAFGAVGLFSTLGYDLITNAVSGLLTYNSVWLGLLTMNVPLPLGIIHEASNFVFFATVTPVLLRLLSKGAIPTWDRSRGEELEQR